MKTHVTLPPSLDAFLDQRVSLFAAPPDADWYSDIAQIYGRTPNAVEAAFHAKWIAVREVAAPVAPPAQVAGTVIDARHPFDRVLDALRSRGCRILPKHDARGRESKRATCPAHDDRNPSLVVTSDGPNVLLHCFGGCPTARVAAALGMKLADLFSGPKQPRSPRQRTVAAKLAAAPPLSQEERLLRKRKRTAERTRRWRERRRSGSSVTLVTHPEHTGDAVTLGDVPNVLPVTSLSVSRDPVSVELGDQPVSREIPPDVSIYADLTKRSPTGGDDWRRRR